MDVQSVKELWEHGGGFSVDGQVRYFGVLAPNSHKREQAIEIAGPSGAIQMRLEEAAQKMALAAQPEEPTPKKKASRTWAILMARIRDRRLR